MLIARSTCSEPGVRRSDPSVRSPGKQTREPQRKQIRFGLVTPVFAANLPEMVKPETDPEATSVCRGSANRGDWERRARHTFLGPTSLRELAEIMVDHDRLHMQQAAAAVRK